MAREQAAIDTRKSNMAGDVRQPLGCAKPCPNDHRNRYRGMPAIMASQPPRTAPGQNPP